VDIAAGASQMSARIPGASSAMIRILRPWIPWNFTASFVEMPWMKFASVMRNSVALGSGNAMWDCLRARRIYFPISRT